MLAISMLAPHMGDCMTASSHRRTALLNVHMAVVLFGLAGVLGKMTSLPANGIVLGRVVFGGAALACLIMLRHVSIRPQTRRDLLGFAGSGLLLAGHWTAFFQSVRVSSVATALLSFSTFPLFATVLEPLLLRERATTIEVLAAALIVPGMFLVVPSLSLTNTTTVGAMWGLLAGFTFALLSIWNRRLTRRYRSVVISLYQDSFAAIALLPTLLLTRTGLQVSIHDVLVLVVLGVACTAISHTLFIEGMRTVSAQTASVVAALEPVWGIVFAFVLLREIPSSRTVLGGILIVGATLVPAIAPRTPVGDLSGVHAKSPLPPAHTDDTASRERSSDQHAAPLADGDAP